jgi:hypothetical protein
LHQAGALDRRYERDGIDDQRSLEVDLDAAPVDAEAPGKEYAARQAYADAVVRSKFLWCLRLAAAV